MDTKLDTVNTVTVRYSDLIELNPKNPSTHVSSSVHTENEADPQMISANEASFNGSSRRDSGEFLI